MRYGDDLVRMVVVIDLREGYVFYGIEALVVVEVRCS